MADTIEIKGWQVVTWKHGNVGGESLVCSPGAVDGMFGIVTAPSNWGHGSWGPFPVSCVTAVRDVCPDDSWGYPGSLNARWTAAALLKHLRHGMGFDSYKYKDMADSLEAALGGA
jgi:hypothetical protein